MPQTRGSRQDHHHVSQGHSRELGATGATRDERATAGRTPQEVHSGTGQEAQVPGERVRLGAAVTGSSADHLTAGEDLLHVETPFKRGDLNPQKQGVEELVL